MVLTLNPLTPPSAEPETWPRFLDTNLSAAYLSQILGLQVEPQTLANYRALGKGPKWKYFGQKPLAERTELERWVNEEALSDESPLTRRARERKRKRSTPHTVRIVDNAIAEPA
jgi:hypothetical protein